MNDERVQHEVDLKKAYGSVKDGSLNTLSLIIKLIKRNLLILLLLIVSGFVIGYFLEMRIGSYKSTLMVVPNFNTTDYLYEKVELLNSKVLQRDKEFLESNGIQYNEEIKLITIKPLTDVYNFIGKNDNYQVFQTLTANANADDVLNDLNTAKYYPRHLVEIKSDIPLEDSYIQSIIAFLNTSEYYEKMRVLIHSNVAHKVQVNNEVVDQIDEILKQYKESGAKASSIYIEDGSELNDLVNNKLDLIHENHKLSTTLYDLEYIITPVNYFLNMNASSRFGGKLRFLIPIFLVTLFIIFKLVRYLDRLQPNEVAK
ncbi:hypothetical protein GO491_07815 [Flavobacteriaceae bacterium Ap0902]|nr:hypothetical protein [Flavobacteriaceae bacterium Ap0902]